MVKEKIPCKDCITYPMCKPKIKFKNKGDLCLINMFDLFNSCSQFKNWWENNENEKSYKTLLKLFLPNQ
jgi:hypothetical protein